MKFLRSLRCLVFHSPTVIYRRRWILDKLYGHGHWLEYTEWYCHNCGKIVP